MAEVPDYVVRRPLATGGIVPLAEGTFEVTLLASSKAVEQAMANLGVSMLDATRRMMVLSTAAGPTMEVTVTEKKGLVAQVKKMILGWADVP